MASVPPLPPLLLSAKEAFEKELLALFPLPSELNSWARYALSPPAKRFRPLLLIATSLSYGAPLEKSLSAACALELIHTYSLIHDDLPCMDNDDIRRGKPSLHRAFSEWQALLTGDYLLTLAFEILSKAPLPPADIVTLIRTFSTQAGKEGMIGGQVIDLLCVKQEISHKTLQEMHLKKTASLLIAALVGGAIIGNAPLKDKELLNDIGACTGLAYQLQDDLLDYTSTTEELGKPVLSDASKQKPTAVSLLGEEKTKEHIASLKHKVFNDLSHLSCDASLLHSLLVLLFCRKK